MGIIKAAGEAFKGAIKDQWLEVMEPDIMGEHTVFTPGIKVRQGENTKGADNIVSNGSLIRVFDNQFMIVVDGGKVVDYTAEPGYYKVDNSSAPSLLNGQFGDTLKDAFNRIRFGGESPREQKVYYINLQEIKGIKFGTRNPINYFDNFYNAELFLRAHGSYSIKVINPLQFYAEVIPRNKEHVEIEEVNEQYISEFLQALQAAINRMSADGIRVSHVTGKALELGKYMSTILDEDWGKMRGMEIQAVGIASMTYDEESKKLINYRNEGAMMSDPSVREGYVQAHMVRGLEAAASNEAGAMHGFLGMGMGMNFGGNVVGQMSQTNTAQMQQQAAAQQGMGMPGAGAPQQPNMAFVGGVAQPGTAPQQVAPQQTAPTTWTCTCGSVNTGKFCPQCGAANSWTCSCGTVNTGKFCTECGKART